MSSLPNETKVKAHGPFRAIQAIDRRLSESAAFVTIVVEDEIGNKFSYDTSCFSFDLKFWVPS